MIDSTFAAEIPRRRILFCFDVSPLLNTTDDFAMPNSSASVSTSSLLALPSTGAHLMRTLTASPTLTTVRLHQRRCGSEAAKLLLELIGDEEEEAGPWKIARHEGIKLGYRIIERESL